MLPLSSRTYACVIGIVLALASAAADASLISYDVRDISNYAFGDYQAGWAAQGTGVASSSPVVFDNLAGGNNSYDHLHVTFNVGGAYVGNALQFQLAPDAGYGGGLYFDGVLLNTNATDLWWGGDWNNLSELLIGNVGNVTAGLHTMDAYWAEGCCNGGQSGRFSVNGGAWQALSTSNLDRLAVPEPGSLALLGLGLASFAATRRKKAGA